MAVTVICPGYDVIGFMREVLHHFGYVQTWKGHGRLRSVIDTNSVITEQAATKFRRAYKTVSTSGHVPLPE